MKFTKMQGLGNDYIYVYTVEEDVPEPSKTAVAVSDRHFGIGSDGLILIGRNGAGTFTMDIYNADGSRGKMCGNGIRCVGKYLYDRGLTGGSDEVDIDTQSGVKHLKLIVSGGKCTGASVNMGSPEFEPSKVPYNPSFASDGKLRLAGGTELFAEILSMGNPHCVIFTDPGVVSSLDLEKVGPLFENHPAFPERVNTEFIEVTGENELKMRVWERGSGETLACGTGACAAAVAAVRRGFCAAGAVTVHLAGGDLQIFWDGGDVIMTGPAETVCEGEYFTD